MAWYLDYLLFKMDERLSHSAWPFTPPYMTRMSIIPLSPILFMDITISANEFLGKKLASRGLVFTYGLNPTCPDLTQIIHVQSPIHLIF